MRFGLVWCLVLGVWFPPSVFIAFSTFFTESQAPLVRFGLYCIICIIWFLVSLNVFQKAVLGFVLQFVRSFVRSFAIYLVLLFLVPVSNAFPRRPNADPDAGCDRGRPGPLAALEADQAHDPSGQGADSGLEQSCRWFFIFYFFLNLVFVCGEMHRVSRGGNNFR